MTEGDDDTAERNTVDDFGDGDEDYALHWWSFPSMTDSRGLALAALVLAAISLLGIEAGAGWMARAAIVVGALAFVIDFVGLILVLAMHIHAPTPAGPGVLRYRVQR